MASTTIEEVLALAGWDKAEAAKVKKHGIVHAPVESLTERELAAGFALLLKMSPDEVEEVFLKSEDKEEADDTIQQMGRMDSNGNLDFSKVQLLPSKSAKDMVKAYVNCGPGDDLNLSNEEMKLFHALDKKHATKEQVEEVLRQVLAKRLQDYQQSGLEGIAPYARKGKNFEPGKELLERTKKLAVAAKVSPEFVKYQIEYPNSKPSDSVKEAYGWINFLIDDKPTISLFHKTWWKASEKCYMVCHRHFYVSRGHNSVQAFGGGFPVEEDQTLMFYSSRTSTDRVAGFGGSAKKAMGSRIMGGRLKENFGSYRAHILEKKESKG